MARGRRGKRRHEEEHENHERWLVTYADMLTLLMVLFIVMFAMSSVDEKKYNALRSGLADGFGQQSSFMKGSDALLDGEGQTVAEELVSNKEFQGLPSSQKAIVTAAVTGQERRAQLSKYDEAKAERDRLEAVRKRLEAALRKHGLLDDVQTTIDERGLVVSLVSRHVVFDADVATLSARGQLVVDVLAPVFRDIPDPLRIDGHTNQVAVHPKYYPTDWDLSAARAVTVLRRLNEVGHVPQTRLTMSAFGHERPLVDPALPRSQDVNKRVDIVVLSQISPEARALLASVGRARPGFDERTVTP